MYRMIASNKRQTFYLFGIIFTVLSLIGFGLGWMIGYLPLGFWFLGIVGVITLFVFLTATSNIVSLMHGVEADPSNPQHRELINIVENLSITAGIKTPTIFILPEPSLNAFAAGINPDKAIVGATQGLLDSMNRNEIEAVMGHEIGHIINYDTRVNVASYAIAASLLLIGEILIRTRLGNKNPLPVVGILILLVGYPIVFLTRLAISRQREYLADVSSVKLTRHPEAMASALEKLKHGGEVNLPNSVSHMFLNTGNKTGWFRKIMSSHPPLDDRIQRVRESFNSM